MSFTEFSYQLIQGYDFYWLYNQRNCKLQMGGSDQWGNIVTGTELVRRKAGGSAFALTCPLLKKADGGKFGKTETGNVWLDANRTTPYQFYQFWLNASDTDAESWIKIFTFLPEAEIHTLIEQHRAQESLRLLQKKLAEEVTRFVHGEEALQQALATTQQLFGKADKPVHELSEDDLRSIEGIMHAAFPAGGLQQGVDIISLVADTGIFPSRGEARKMIQNGGLSINRNKIQDPQQLIDSSWLLHEKFLLVQKGKKQFFLIEIQG